MSAPVQVMGLDGWRKRLAALAAVKGLEPALQAEAEAVAEAARATLTSRDPASPLARPVQIVDISQGDRPAFAIGTEDPGGWFLEFGTTRTRASPWLGTALHARSRAINHTVGKVIAAASKVTSKV